MTKISLHHLSKGRNHINIISNKLMEYADKYNLIRLYNNDRTYFNININLAPYIELFSNHAVKNSVSFFNKLFEWRYLTNETKRFIKEIALTDKTKRFVNIYDINKSYLYQLKNLKFAISTVDFTSIQRINNNNYQPSFTEQSIFVESTDLDKYNFLIYVNIYHNEEILNSILKEFNINNLKDLVTLNKKQIRILKYKYPYIYAPYMPLNMADNVDLTHKIESTYRPIITKNNRYKLWLLKEERVYCKSVGYIIEPLYGYNARKFESIESLITFFDDSQKKIITAKSLIGAKNGAPNLKRNSDLIKTSLKFRINRFVGLTAQHNIKIPLRYKNLTKVRTFSDYNILLQQQYRNNLQAIKLDLPGLNNVYGLDRMLNYKFSPIVYITKKHTFNFVLLAIITNRRMHIHSNIINLLIQQEHVYMSNVDSIFTTGHLPTSTEIGHFKQEHNSLKSFFAYRPNNYIIHNNDGILVKGSPNFTYVKNNTGQFKFDFNSNLITSRILLSHPLSKRIILESLPKLRHKQEKIIQDWPKVVQYIPLDYFTIPFNKDIPYLLTPQIYIQNSIILNRKDINHYIFSKDYIYKNFNHYQFEYFLQFGKSTKITSNFKFNLYMGRRVYLELYLIIFLHIKFKSITNEKVISLTNHTLDHFYTTFNNWIQTNFCPEAFNYFNLLTKDSLAINGIDINQIFKYQYTFYIKKYIENYPFGIYHLTRYPGIRFANLEIKSNNIFAIHSIEEYETLFTQFINNPIPFLHNELHQTHKSNQFHIIQNSNNSSKI